MSTDLPPHWEAALIKAGIVDQRGRTGRASRRELAKRVTRELERTEPVNVSTITAMINGTRHTGSAIVGAVARILGTRDVYDWVGQSRRDGPAFMVPDEANLLTPRQQSAIKELIRAIAEERDGHGQHPAAISEAGETPAQVYPATSDGTAGRVPDVPKDIGTERAGRQPDARTRSRAKRSRSTRSGDGTTGGTTP